jgi:acyl carrier protein
METTSADAKHFEKLKMLLTNVLDIGEDFSETDHFMDDLGLSSLMKLEVMVALEKEFNIKFKEDELNELTSVLNVYEVLKEKGAKFD